MAPKTKKKQQQQKTTAMTTNLLHRSNSQKRPAQSYIHFIEHNLAVLCRTSRGHLVNKAS